MSKFKYLTSAIFEIVWYKAAYMFLTTLQRSIKHCISNKTPVSYSPLSFLSTYIRPGKYFCKFVAFRKAGFEKKKKRGSVGRYLTSKSVQSAALPL